MELLFDFLFDALAEGFVPGDEEARAGRVFGLGEHIGGDEAWVGGCIGDDYHFAGSGDGVDIDFAVDGFFGEGNVEVSGSDDLIDGRDRFGAVGEGGDALSAAHGIDFFDPQFMADGENIGIEGTEGGGRCHDGDLWYTGHEGWYGGHQDRGWVGGGTTRNADPDSLEGRVALGEAKAGTRFDGDVGGQEGLLKSLDRRTNSNNGFDEGGTRGAACFDDHGGGDTERGWRRLKLIESSGVAAEGGVSLLPNIAADTIHDFARGERSTKHAFGELSAFGAGDISVDAQTFPEGGDERGGLCSPVLL